MSKRKQSGFTLIELIICIFIIGFIISVFIGMGLLLVGGHFIAKFW